MCLHIYSYICNYRNVTRVVNGPATFTVQEHEKVISSGVQHMIVIRPYHFLIVEVWSKEIKTAMFRSQGRTEIKINQHICLEQCLIASMICEMTWGCSKTSTDSL